jgi:hypothetical protein
LGSSLSEFFSMKKLSLAALFLLGGIELLFPMQMALLN